MSRAQRKLTKVTFDYETQSEADLKALGAYKYSQHPSTDILCVAWKVEEEPTKIWIPKSPKLSTGNVHEFSALFINPHNRMKAHNAFFEQVITRNVLPRYVVAPQVKELLQNLKPDRFDDTAAKAAAVAIPRSLQGAGEVMGLGLQKDMRGNALMKKYMKPRPAWKKWKLNGRVGPEPKKYHDDEFELWEIYDYCIRDVESEHELDLKLPDLIPFERDLWLINQEMNLRGVQIDLKTVNKVIRFMKEETKILTEEVVKLTNGKLDSVLQTKKLKEFLEDAGDMLPDLKKKTVNDALASGDLEPVSRRLLEIRNEIGKTSNKKFYAMRARAGDDGRVRDLALYHGASTGRESGTGLQIHNLPKGTINTSDDYAISLLNTEKDLDFIRFIYGNPFEVFSSCVRGMITASPGYTIVDADLNAIECRVVNWLARSEEVLGAFERNEDPYVIMASRIFGIPIESVNGGQRFLGKTAELGCGYQMGGARFFQTCIDWGVPNVTMELAEKAVKIYRETHPNVVNMWKMIEKAAITAVQRNVKITVHRVSWFMKDDFLWCLLPSGRALAFRKPTVRMEKSPWGELMPKLYHWQVDSLTKKWVNRATYGGKLCENISQAIARDVTMNGLVQTKALGYKYLFQCHDEIISEIETDKVDVAEYSKAMGSRPAWAPDLPVKAAGWAGQRYKKD